MDFNYIGTGIKLLISTLGAWLAVKLGTLYPVMLVLLIVMAMDFATAWLRAIATSEGLQSRKCSVGIVKKVLYLLCVGVGLVLDYLIALVAIDLNVDVQMSFGLLVAIWLILNDLVSILENISRAGVKLPGILMQVIKKLQKYVDVESDERQHSNHTGN